MKNAATLARVIDQSGLSARRFAREVLLRDERTIRRWLADDVPIPEPVTVKFDEWLALPQGWAVGRDEYRASLVAAVQNGDV